MMIMAVVATSLTIVREKERNTIEQLIVSPIRMYELIIAKLVSPLFIAFIAAMLILLTGYILFGIQIKRSGFTFSCNNNFSSYFTCIWSFYFCSCR